MGKIKNWIKDHKVEIMIYGTVIASVALGGYLGYKAGKEVGQAEGFDLGIKYLPTKALLDTDVINDDNIHEGGRYIMDCMRLDENPDHLIPDIDELMAGLAKDGADREKTAIIAVSVMKE